MTLMTWIGIQVGKEEVAAEESMLAPNSRIE